MNVQDQVDLRLGPEHDCAQRSGALDVGAAALGVVLECPGAAKSRFSRRPIPAAATSMGGLRAEAQEPCRGKTRIVRGAAGEPVNSDSNRAGPGRTPARARAAGCRPHPGPAWRGAGCRPEASRIRPPMPRPRSKPARTRPAGHHASAPTRRPGASQRRVARPDESPRRLVQVVDPQGTAEVWMSAALAAEGVRQGGTGGVEQPGTSESPTEVARSRSRSLPDRFLREIETRAARSRRAATIVDTPRPKR